MAYFREIWFLWLLCLISNIITFFIIRYKINPGNRPLALHYNVLVGVDWFGAGKNLYFIPAIGLVIAAANLMLFKTLGKDENFLSFLTAFVSLSIQIILLFAVLFLASIN